MKFTSRGQPRRRGRAGGSPGGFRPPSGTRRRTSGVGLAEKGRGRGWRLEVRHALRFPDQDEDAVVGDLRGPSLGLEQDRMGVMAATLQFLSTRTRSSCSALSMRWRLLSRTPWKRSPRQLRVTRLRPARLSTSAAWMQAAPGGQALRDLAVAIQALEGGLSGDLVAGGALRGPAQELVRAGERPGRDLRARRGCPSQNQQQRPSCEERMEVRDGRRSAGRAATAGRGVPWTVSNPWSLFWPETRERLYQNWRSGQAGSTTGSQAPGSDRDWFRFGKQQRALVSILCDRKPTPGLLAQRTEKRTGATRARLSGL